MITQRTASDTAPSGQACGGIASGLVDGAGSYSAVMNNPRVDSHNVKANVERLCTPELQQRGGGGLGCWAGHSRKGRPTLTVPHCPTRMGRPRAQLGRDLSPLESRGTKGVPLGGRVTSQS